MPMRDRNHFWKLGPPRSNRSNRRIQDPDTTKNACIHTSGTQVNNLVRVHMMCTVRLDDRVGIILHYP